MQYLARDSSYHKKYIDNVCWGGVSNSAAYMRYCLLYERGRELPFQSVANGVPVG